MYAYGLDQVLNFSRLTLQPGLIPITPHFPGEASVALSLQLKGVNVIIINGMHWAVGGS